jgi:transcriptional regulator with XRE-family HTH domain
MKLKKWLEETGVQLKDFCLAIGVHRCYLYLIRTNKRNPSRKLLMKIQGITSGNVTTHQDLLEKRAENKVDT